MKAQTSLTLCCFSHAIFSTRPNSFTPPTSPRTAPSTYLLHTTDPRLLPSPNFLSSSLSPSSPYSRRSSVDGSSDPTLTGFESLEEARTWINISPSDHSRLEKTSPATLDDLIVKQFLLTSLVGQNLEEDLGYNGGAVETEEDEWSSLDLGVWEDKVKNEGHVRYEDVCFKETKEGGCFSLGPSISTVPSFPQQRILTLFLSTTAPTSKLTNFLEHLSNLETTSLNSTLSSSSSYTFHPSAHLPTTLFSGSTSDLFAPSSSPRQQSNSIRWIGYAVRALGMRFWALAKNADSADIFVVLLGYVLMHLTFVRLFLNMRKMGSSFWLREFTLVA